MSADLARRLNAPAEADGEQRPGEEQTEHELPARQADLVEAARDVQHPVTVYKNILLQACVLVRLSL